MNKPAEEAVKRIGRIFDEAIARERAKLPDDDEVRQRQDEERKGNDDREWAKERDRRSGAFPE